MSTLSIVECSSCGALYQTHDPMTPHDCLRAVARTVAELERHVHERASIHGMRTGANGSRDTGGFHVRPSTVPPMISEEADDIARRIGALVQTFHKSDPRRDAFVELAVLARELEVSTEARTAKRIAEWAHASADSDSSWMASAIERGDWR